jgi:LEA14-like dessication related protein
VNRTRLAATAAALLVLTASGCAALGQLARSAFDPPKLEFVDWSARALDAEGVTIGLQYKLTNPNSQGFRLSRVGWALDLEGKPAAKGDMPTGLTVPANGSAPLELPVRVRWRDVPDLVKLLVSPKGDVGFKVTGVAALAGPLGDVELPFSREGRVDLPRVPGFGIEGIRVRELSLTNVSLDLRLRVSNANKFPLPVGALAYGLRLGGEPVASGDGKPLAAVPPGGEATVTIPVRLSLASAGGAIRRLLQGESLPAELDGTAEFGDLQFPFSAEGAARPPERAERH